MGKPRVRRSLRGAAALPQHEAPAGRPPAPPPPSPEWIEAYTPRTDSESADLARAVKVAASTQPFDRSSPSHLTGSAVVVHRATRRVLLRWHERERGWLQVGGHGDEGETDPYDVAIREAREETGLTDLTPLGPPGPVHIVGVISSAKGSEPEHEHIDVRYVLSTEQPDAAQAEAEHAPLRWLPIEDAIASVRPNLAETLRRVAERLPRT